MCFKAQIASDSLMVAHAFFFIGWYALHCMTGGVLGGTRSVIAKVVS